MHDVKLFSAHMFWGLTWWLTRENAKSSLKIVIVIVFLSSETYRKSNVTLKDGMIDHEHFFCHDCCVEAPYFSNIVLKSWCEICTSRSLPLAKLPETGSTFLLWRRGGWDGRGADKSTCNLSRLCCILQISLICNFTLCHCTHLFGPIWTLFDHFRQKWFFAPNGQSRVWRRYPGAKN